MLEANHCWRCPTTGVALRLQTEALPQPRAPDRTSRPHSYHQRIKCICHNKKLNTPLMNTIIHSVPHKILIFQSLAS